MKKDIEWLKKEIEEYLAYEGVRYARIALESVLGYIDQLDEPEKPVIPKFVADYYKEYQNHELTFSKWFKSPPLNKGSRAETETFKWLLRNEHKTNLERQFILADIIAHGLDGYEVEKEPHYCVAFEGEFNLLYVTHVDIYGENGKFNYNSVFDKKHALKFTDKSRAKYLADFLGAIVVEVTPCN